MIQIRGIRTSDAEELLKLSDQTDRETSFMLIEPGEQRTTVEQEREQIERILRRDNQVILVAEENGHLVGQLVASGGNFRRNRGLAHIYIGILKSHWGQGIGTRLFQVLEDWAREYGIHRLELSVQTDNERAIHLYKKVGFEIEGIKRQTLLVDGVYRDEYLMSKIVE